MLGVEPNRPNGKTNGQPADLVVDETRLLIHLVGQALEIYARSADLATGATPTNTNSSGGGYMFVAAKTLGV